MRAGIQIEKRRGARLTACRVAIPGDIRQLPRLPQPRNVFREASSVFRLPLALIAALALVPASSAQPVLQTTYEGGITRAVILHAGTRETVTDANPAKPGESLIAFAQGSTDEIAVMVDDAKVSASKMPVAPSRPRLPYRARSSHVSTDSEPPAAVSTSGAWEEILFNVPDEAGGSFVEIGIESAGERSNSATTIVEQAQEDPTQLTTANVDAMIRRSAMAIDNSGMAIAVVDRAGRPLGVFAKPAATAEGQETALSLARTGAFFSHNMAPLSSRTVQTISRENFPNNVPNQPAAALFGIENTNRGCTLSTNYEPGQSVPPATSLTGPTPGKGVTTVPGGIPIFKGGILVGGIGVAGIDPNAAEFAALAGFDNSELFFAPLPLPPPGTVFIDGIRLPFVEQTTQPAGTQPATNVTGQFIVAPRAGQPVPDGYLVTPRASATMTAQEVDQIIQRAVARAQLTRAVIRLPLGSRSRMVMSVSDLDGNILALFRMPDATVFSIDVAATKARNVVYFSGPNRTAGDLPGVPMGTAITNRTIGFGSQSFFPSGIANSTPGPFRQLYLDDLANPCTQGAQPANPNQSGVVFFPGSVPLYRNGQLIGGLGVSGDGVEQDDYVTAGGAAGFEPPPDLRADRVFVDNVRLPFWRFPRNPEQ